MKMNVDARVLLLDERGWILLVRDKSKPIVKPNGESFTKLEGWGMPGGRSEPEDKDEIATAEREVLHEIGIFPEINVKIRVEKQRPDHLKVAFIGYPTSGTIKIDPEEILEARWFPRRVLYDETFKMYAIQREMAQELLERGKRG